MSGRLVKAEPGQLSGGSVPSAASTTGCFPALLCFSEGEPAVLNPLALQEDQGGKGCCLTHSHKWTVSVREG